MSSVFYYEPFYNFDRFFDELLGRPQNNNNRIQGSQSSGAEGVTSVALRPKYVALRLSLTSITDN